MLVFHNGSNTSYANYADNLTSMSSATTAITMRFLGQGASATATSTDAVVLTVTAGKEEEMMELLAGAVAEGRSGMTVIADDQNSKYISGHITAVDSISVDTGAGLFKNVIDKAATANVLEITNADSGSNVYLRNNGAGCEIRLPLAPVDGFNFKLIAKQDMDSNNYDIKATSGGPTAFEGVVQEGDAAPTSETGTAQVRITGANFEMGDYLEFVFNSTANKYFFDGMCATASAVTAS